MYESAKFARFKEFSLVFCYLFLIEDALEAQHGSVDRRRRASGFAKKKKKKTSADGRASRIEISPLNRFELKKNNNNKYKKLKKATNQKGKKKPKISNGSRLFIADGDIRSTNKIPPR